MNLDALETLAKDATPGPWKAIGGKCLAGVVAPDCQIYLHDARPDMFFSLPRWQATASYIAAASPDAVLKLIAVARAAQASIDAGAKVTAAEDDSEEWAEAMAEATMAGIALREALAALTKETP